MAWSKHTPAAIRCGDDDDPLDPLDPFPMPRACAPAFGFPPGAPSCENRQLSPRAHDPLDQSKHASRRSVDPPSYVVVTDDDDDLDPFPMGDALFDVRIVSSARFARSRAIRAASGVILFPISKTENRKPNRSIFSPFTTHDDFSRATFVSTPDPRTTERPTD